jgi:hypothetical protein
MLSMRSIMRIRPDGRSSDRIAYRDKPLDGKQAVESKEIDIFSSTISGRITRAEY